MRSLPRQPQFIIKFQDKSYFTFLCLVKNKFVGSLYDKKNTWPFIYISMAIVHQLRLEKIVEPICKGHVLMLSISIFVLI